MEEESKAGDAGCEGQEGNLLPCNAKAINSMYNYASSKGFENSAWNREGRKCKTREKEKSLVPNGPVERRLGGRAGVGYGEATQSSIGKMIEMFQ